MLSSHQTKGRGQVGFPHTGRSEKDHIFSVLQKAHGSQFIDLALVDGGLEGKSKSSRVFLMGKPDICTCFS